MSSRGRPAADASQYDQPTCLLLILAARKCEYNDKDIQTKDQSMLAGVAEVHDGRRVRDFDCCSK